MVISSLEHTWYKQWHTLRSWGGNSEEELMMAWKNFSVIWRRFRWFSSRLSDCSNLQNKVMSIKNKLKNSASAKYNVWTFMASWFERANYKKKKVVLKIVYKNSYALINSTYAFNFFVNLVGRKGLSCFQLLFRRAFTYSVPVTLPLFWTAFHIQSSISNC